MTYTVEPLGAGGWVTGNVISPDGLTRLGRTDTMGAWRWSTAADAWVSSIDADSMPAPNNALDSGEGVQAVIASNSSAFMSYKNGIYKSVDRGVTWTLNLANGPTTAPNMGNQRWWGQRMAFDPSDSNILIYGTLNAGLWYTLNGGTSWSAVSSGSLPFGSDGAVTPGKETFGINAVAITPNGNWWAAPYGNGIYRSTDHGSTWTQVSAGNFIVTRYLRGGPNNDIMAATHNTLTRTDQAQMWRYSGGTWTNVKPTKNQPWHSIAYDPTSPGRVMALADGFYQAISLDYGTTWAQPLKTMESQADIPWLETASGFGVDGFFNTLGELNFDPVVSGRVWLSQGIGVWYADLPATVTAVVPWHAQSRGIEQLVVNDVLAPPGGPPVVTSWDRAIFLAGETSSPPVVSVAAVAATPITTPASLEATLLGGFPKNFTYAWSIVSKPAASNATTAAFGSTSALQTIFTPDATGSYTLRLTATNSAGSSTTDVTFTASTKVTSLILPGSTGNYIDTPAASQLDLTGSMTMEADLSLPDWAPVTRVPIMGKYNGTQKSYAMGVDSTGLLGWISTAANGSTGALAVPSGALVLPPGSRQKVRVVYDATAHTMRFERYNFATSTWVLIKSVNTGTLTAVATTTASLTLGAFPGANTTYLNGRIYSARVLDATGTVVANFDATGVTRTGTRTPATYTGTAGLTWTPLGTGWDWTA